MPNILHPSRYHGFSAKAPYFEGWYYKLVTSNHSKKLAVIPGVYIAPDSTNSHCFVQVFDSEAETVRFHRYPYQDFKPSSKSFEIRVGPNYFSADKIQLAIDDEAGQLAGSLTFKNRNPWPVRFFAPGAMGWFAWVPFMECYHGVVSMDHSIQGKLHLDGNPVDFTGGRGYIEKDWGKQFPSAWIWGQSNHFDKDGISLMLSVAVIPWLGFSFAGFIIGLLHNGVIHRFSTYNRSRIERIELNDSEVKLNVRNATHRLEIRASRATGGLLQAPTTLEMDRRIIETLNAQISIRFEHRSGEMIYAGSGQHAGLETVGDLDNLIKMIKSD